MVNLFRQENFAFAVKKGIDPDPSPRAGQQVTYYIVVVVTDTETVHILWY